MANVIIHAAGLMFSGQGYTGISRVPAMENLYFLELERASFFISKTVLSSHPVDGSN